uniref:Uncharacterized protein n=1 Tax=Rhabditophanes sp. KR3021 TaxID=114890 RepID=A0AC35TJ60_9BILA
MKTKSAIWVIVVLFVCVIFNNINCNENEKQTFIIVGPSQMDLGKRVLANQMGVTQHIQEPSELTLFTIYTNLPQTTQNLEDISKDQRFVVKRVENIKNTIIIAWKSALEMNLEELNLFGDLIFEINEGLGVVELGPFTVQLETLVKRSALCFGRSEVVLETTNKIYMCNNFEYKHFDLLDTTKPILNIKPTRQHIKTKVPSKWNFNLIDGVEAIQSYDSDQVRGQIKHTHNNKMIHMDAKKLKQIRYANAIKKRKNRKYKRWVADKVILNHDALSGAAKKLECKYRRSCYDTGVLHIESIDHKESLDLSSDAHEATEEEEAELSVDQLKAICKYRKSCYDNVGISEEEKKLLEEDSEGRSILSATKLVLKAPKKTKTLKELAQKALESAMKRKEEAIEIAEESVNYASQLKFNAKEAEFRKKAECKFRKSCYETGHMPEIEVIEGGYYEVFEEKFYSLQELFNIDAFKSEQIAFEDLEEEDKMAYCKYRKSCYESGVIPEISKEEVFEFVDIIEPYQKTLEEKCKFRKSCYESGILPKLHEDEIVVESTFKQILVPHTVSELKSHCKYRKTCYADKADVLERIEEYAEEPAEEPIAEKHQPKVHTNKKVEEKIEEVEEGVDKTEKEIEEKTEEIEEEIVEIKPVKVKKSKKVRVEVPVVDIAEEVIEKPIKIQKSKKKRDVGVKEEIPAAEEDIPKPIKSKKQKKAPKVIVEEIVEPEALPIIEEEIPVVEEEVIEVKVPKVDKKKKSKSAKKDAVAEPIVKEDEPEEIQVHEEPHAPTEANELEQANINLACKYRKSCYESGNVPKIETSSYDLDLDYDLSQLYAAYELAASYVAFTEHRKPAALSEEESEDENAKLACKYRKSCYETGQIPEIEEQPFYVNYGSQEEATPSDKVSEDNFELDDSKLACKYRKSCYETGEIPTIISHVFEAVVPVTDKVDHQKDQEEDASKLACKYRKSCYETGEIPQISEDYFDSPLSSVTPEGETIITDVSTDDGKLACKYRTSCYETGKVPVIVEDYEQVKETLRAQQLQSVDVDDDSEADMKLLCKYRKSCYETGKIPENLNDIPEHVEDIQNTPGMTLELMCKYRKSCYGKAGKVIHDMKEVKRHGKKDSRKTIKKDESKDQTSTSKKDKSKKKDELKESKKAKKDFAKLEEAPQKETVKADLKKEVKADLEKEPVEVDLKKEETKKDSKKEEVKEEIKVSPPHIPNPQQNFTIELTRDIKSVCKYRESCYHKIQDGTPLLEINPQFSRIMMKSCNTFRVSCRQRLGLPLYQKAPRAKNGKKLCPKKKVVLTI